MNNFFVITLKPDQQVRAMEKYCYALQDELIQANPKLRFTSHFCKLYEDMVIQILIEDNILNEENSNEGDMV